MKKIKDIKDLAIRIKVLETIYTSKLLYSKINKKTVERWLRCQSNPRESSLLGLCNPIGITVSDLFRPINEFAEILINLEDHSFTEDQIKEAINKFNKPDADSSAQFFKNAINFLSKETVRSEYKILDGFYRLYHHWRGSNDKVQAEKKSSVLTAIIEISEFNEPTNTIQFKVYTREDVYDGFIVSIDKSLYWFIECPEGSLNYPDIGLFVTVKPTKWGVKRHYGVLVANTPGGEAPFIQPALPCASRIVLKKIDREEVESLPPGYITIDDIKKIEDDSEIIINAINNRQSKAEYVLSVEL